MQTSDAPVQQQAVTDNVGSMEGRLTVEQFNAEYPIPEGASEPTCPEIDVVVDWLKGLNVDRRALMRSRNPDWQEFADAFAYSVDDMIKQLDKLRGLNSTIREGSKQFREVALELYTEKYSRAQHTGNGGLLIPESNSYNT